MYFVDSLLIVCLGVQIQLEKLGRSGTTPYRMSVAV